MLEPIANALREAMQKFGTSNVAVAFKAMHEDVDSFGALQCALTPCLALRAHVFVGWLSTCLRCSNAHIHSHCGRQSGWLVGMFLVVTGES